MIDPTVWDSIILKITAEQYRNSEKDARTQSEVEQKNLPAK